MTARPRYETPAHRALEERVAAACARNWHVVLTKTRDGAYVDRLAWRGKTVVGVLEIKVRTWKPWQYPSVVLTAAKARRLVAEAKRRKARPLFVVGLADRSVWWADLSEHETLPTRTGGRTTHQRDEWDAAERVIDVPRDWFQRLRAQGERLDRFRRVTEDELHAVGRALGVAYDARGFAIGGGAV